LLSERYWSGQECDYSKALARLRPPCHPRAKPIEYQRHSGEPTDATKLLRTLHFGRRHEGLLFTFLLYPPDNLVLVVQIQGLGE
jgi:hypothetical protein